MSIARLLGASGPGARIGLGLAAVGRPGYITTGRDADLPSDRSIQAMEQRSRDLLDAAYGAGLRYIDVARSYGRAEAFLAGWLAERAPADVVVGSKWGYTYTAQWHTDAPVHEIKDHSVSTFERQLDETMSLLDGHLDLYQVHSLTPDSPALTDPVLHGRLAELGADGVTLGFTVSGAHQAETIRAALAIRVNGRRLFDAVQATWNLLEQSSGAALAAAHDDGVVVIVKEALANGRLATSHQAAPTLGEIAGELKTTPDAIALAAALRQPWADVVLSGAATEAQLSSNLRATHLDLDTAVVRRLLGLVQPRAAYWAARAVLPWT
jgi:aryl-alcohol dehydrogenase-like predicted oxidoreductase